VTPSAGHPNLADEVAEAQYLATARAVRERAQALHALAARGELANFSVDETQLGPLAE